MTDTKFNFIECIMIDFRYIIIFDGNSHMGNTVRNISARCSDSISDDGDEGFYIIPSHEMGPHSSLKTNQFDESKDESKDGGGLSHKMRRTNSFDYINPFDESKDESKSENSDE